MTIESGTYISDFNTSNPSGADAKSEGDDHLRLIKTFTKATFPNVTGAVTPTHTQLNTITNISAGTFPTVALTGVTSITAAGAVTGVTDLTTTGNTVLGDASTDTLNVGNGGIVKDASGNVGFGGTPSTSLHLQRTAAAVTARIEAVTSGTAGLELRAATAGGGATQISFYNVASIMWAMGGGNIGSSAANDFSVYGYTLGRNVFTIANATGDITALGIAISRSKTATTTRSSTAAQADDPHLVAPLGVGTWSFDVWVPVWATTSGAGGLSAAIAFSGTATTGAYSTSTSFINGANIASGTAAIGNGIAPASVSTGTGVTVVDYLRATGTITVSVAGNLSLKWAQASSNVNALNLGIGGWMNCVKVG